MQRFWSTQPQKGLGRLEKPEVMGDCTERVSSRHNRTDGHVNAWRLHRFKQTKSQ